MIRRLLSAALVLAASATPALAKDLDGALQYLPENVSTVVAVDLESTRGTAFFKDLQKELIDLTGYARDIAQMKKEADFDVMANARLIVYAGPDEVIKKAKESLLIVEGTFDPAKIKDFFTKKSKVPVTEAKGPGGTYYLIGDSSAMAFHGNFAVFGSKAMFDNAMAAKAAGGKKTKVSALVARFKSAKGGFAVIGGSAQLRKFLGKDFGDVQDVKSAGMTFDFSKGLALQIVGVFTDANKASSVAQSIAKDLSEMASEPDYKEVGLDTALGKVETKASGAEVTMNLVLDGGSSKQLSASLKELFE
ncbi:MAG: hypothetical protein IT385_13315 [Deltaproteobacteria bacterium]|nr:hypothetical protein [Deltaproteobacteria bacterium]